nr:MAG TPA: hypothetical protein [Caudoviricetes sp.]
MNSHCYEYLGFNHISIHTLFLLSYHHIYFHEYCGVWL